MKNVVYFVCLLFIVIACENGTSKSEYGKTISDFVQTDKSGKKHDFKFKVLELTEKGKITVSDSIAILTDDFRADQQVIINRMELAKTMAQDLIENENKRRNPNQSKIEEYNNSIAVSNHRIDSLLNLSPDNLKGYDKRNPEEVLAVIVQCRYSGVPPSFTKEVEETFDFYLSPDGKTCFGKTKAK